MSGRDASSRHQAAGCAPQIVKHPGAMGLRFSAVAQLGDLLIERAFGLTEAGEGFSPFVVENTKPRSAACPTAPAPLASTALPCRRLRRQSCGDRRDSPSVALNLLPVHAGDFLAPLGRQQQSADKGRKHDGTSAVSSASHTSLISSSTRTRLRARSAPAWYGPCPDDGRVELVVSRGLPIEGLPHMRQRRGRP